MDDQKPPPAEPRPPTPAEIDAVCRPPALRFSKEIVEFANKKFGGYSPFWAPLVAAFTTQNVLIMSLLEGHEPSSDEGLNAINTYFDQCKFQATAHWRSEALKNFGKIKISALVLAP